MSTGILGGLVAVLVIALAFAAYRLGHRARAAKERGQIADQAARRGEALLSPQERADAARAQLEERDA